MKRLCSKLARELSAIATDVADRLDIMADVDAATLEGAELLLRDAIANLRGVRNSVNAARRQQLHEQRDTMLQTTDWPP